MSKTFKDYLKESGLQYYTGVKKHGEEYMKKAAKAGREGASQEELGRLKDKYSKAEKKKKTPEATLEEADKVIFKGKEIDLTKIDYTMRDFSDGMIELNSPVFYTDGTEVADEDLADLNDMPEENFSALAGVPLWIVETLREQPHQAHAHYDLTFSWIDRVKPEQAVLTHLGLEADYQKLKSICPDRVEPGYDGMRFVLELSAK